VGLGTWVEGEVWPVRRARWRTDGSFGLAVMREEAMNGQKVMVDDDRESVASNSVSFQSR